MSRRGPTKPRPWQPLARAVPVPKTPEQIDTLRAQCVEMGFDQAGIDDLLAEPNEIWRNDRYVVHIRRDDGHPVELSIRRDDRGTNFPWRDLQRIKNELAGPEIEAIELFPAESRLIDTANQRWLWCGLPGERIPVGFNSGRHVTDAATAARIGAKQAEPDETRHMEETNQ